MKDQKYFSDTGLFSGRKGSTLPPPDSYETILSMLETIKEYREYHQPNSSSWKEYILHLFNILGFSTKHELKRLTSLYEIGGKRSRKAIAVLLVPGETFQEIIPDLDWESYLFFAAQYFNVEWAILTDGLEFKIFNKDQNFKKFYITANLEKIINKDCIDSFFSLCTIFSLIRGKQIQKNIKLIKKKRTLTGKYDLNHHLYKKSNITISLFDVLRSEIFTLSDQIDEKIHKSIISYSIGEKFCQIHTQKEQLKIWVNLDIFEIYDPLSLCRDVRGIGHYGSGNTEIILKSFEEVDAVFQIINQSYLRNSKNKLKGNVSKSSKRHKLFELFWTQLLESANKRISTHKKVSPNRGNLLRASAGKRGFQFGYFVRKNDAGVELYFDIGSLHQNNEFYYYLYERKDEIHKTFGARLDWQLLEGMRGCRIRYVVSEFGLDDNDHWSEIQELQIEQMISLQKTFQPIIDQL